MHTQMTDELNPAQRGDQRDPVAVRDAQPDEIDQLARVWFDAWRDAHAKVLPAELTRVRTLESFRHRIREGLSNFRVVGPPGDPVGLCVVRADELYQLFVSASSRGSGVAAALLADGETRLAAQGVETAWLACAIGNDRAARFYEKHGWRRVGTMRNRLDGVSGEQYLETWRYEKPLAPISV
jgi:ribosomal protein S18 acetylase RimI-like enzyme